MTAESKLRPLTVTEVSVIQRLATFGLPKKLIAYALNRKPDSINNALSRHGRPQPAYRFSKLDLQIIPHLPDTVARLALILDKPERSVQWALSRMGKAGLVLHSAAPEDKSQWSIWRKCSRLAPTSLDQRVLQHLPATLPDLSAQLGTAIPSVHRSLKRLQQWEAIQAGAERRPSDSAENKYKSTVVWERGPNRMDNIEFAVLALLPATPFELSEKTGKTMAGVIDSLRRLERLGIAQTDGKVRNPGPGATVWKLNHRALEKRYAYAMDDSGFPVPHPGMGEPSGSASAG